MINQKYIQSLKEEYLRYNKERSQIITRANSILHDSKRVIFALHRDDVDKAETALKTIEENITALVKDFSYDRIIKEGSYSAAVEEYAEAKLLFTVLKENKIDKITEVKMEVNSYLGGLSDLAGELVRKATNAASAGNYEKVTEYTKLVNDVLEQLVEFDMTGYMRTKFDQAKQHLRKIEQVNYDVKIRRLEDK